jgi:hypothetical protein
MDAPFGRIVGTEELASGLPIPMKAGYLFSFLNGRTSAARKRNDAVLLRQEKVEISSRSAVFPIEVSMDRFGT